MNASNWIQNPDRQRFLMELAAEALVAGKQRLTYTGAKNDPSPVGGVQPYIHGGGGLLSDPGQNPAIFSSIIHPDMGLWAALPIRNAPIVSGDYGGIDVEYLTTITGVTSGNVDDFDNQPTEACGDAPVAGLLKACTLTAPFGRYYVGIRQVDVRRVGRLATRGETPDFRLQNSGMENNPFAPQMFPSGGDWINDELRSRLYEGATGWQRLLAPRVYTADPTNNTNGARDFVGLDLQINTNKRDAFTQNLCPGMDSAITNFGSVNINDADANGFYIYDWIEAMMYYLQGSADRMGMSPVKWVVSMRRDLFYMLTRIWRVQSYVQSVRMVSTINTTSKDGAQIILSGQEEAKLRDEMYSGRFLTLPNGERLDVVLDDGIEVSVGSPASESVSEIYFVPVTALGGVPVTYWQYFNYDNAQTRRLAEMSRGQIYTTDGGRFLWTWNQRNGCFTVQFSGEPRLMMHTPYLAGRITNVAYQPLISSRSPYPGDSLFYNGGRLTGRLPLTYSEWSPSTPTFPGVVG